MENGQTHALRKHVDCLGQLKFCSSHTVKFWVAPNTNSDQVFWVYLHMTPCTRDSVAPVPHSFLVLFTVCHVLHTVQGYPYPENPANASQPLMGE